MNDIKLMDNDGSIDNAAIQGQREAHEDYGVCPCCGCRTLDPEDSSFEICPVCFWENDPSQIRYPDEAGANKVSLNQARKNYALYGACEERFKEYVREPYEEERGEDN